MQETFRVENVEERVVLDTFKHVLKACILARALLQHLDTSD